MHQKTSTANITKLVACPTCKTLTAFDPTNAFRPFCSARCKMIDLGDWANEHFKIPQPAIVNTPEDE